MRVLVVSEEGKLSGNQHINTAFNTIFCRKEIQLNHATNCSISCHIISKGKVIVVIVKEYSCHSRT